MKIRTVFVELIGLVGWGMMLSLYFGAYPDGFILIDMNFYGEYWIEFILFCVTFICMLIFTIKDYIECFR